MKFRIVELIHNSGSKDRTGEWVIEKKGPFKWREVLHTEVDQRRISHKSYQEAEIYLLEKYTGHGLCRKIGDVYQFSYYVYYV